jgi:hypothetical protein
LIMLAVWSLGHLVLAKATTEARDFGLTRDRKYLFIHLII